MKENHRRRSSWTETIEARAEIIREQLAAARILAEKEGGDPDEIAKPYLKLLDNLYREELDLARLMDASSPTVPIESAAKRLGERSGWMLKNLDMHRMLYIANMFHLGETDGSPLVDGTFEAWDYGAVHPVLYQALKRYGADPVPPEAFLNVEEISNDHLGATLLDKAVDELPRNKLVAITHWEGGAWARIYNSSRNMPIPNDAIIDEYVLRLKNHDERSKERSSTRSQASTVGQGDDR